MQKFIDAVDKISKSSGMITAFLILPMILIIVYTALMRYVFHYAVNWGFELSLFVYGLHFMLGGAYCLNLKSHVIVDIVPSRLPFIPRKVLEGLASLVVLIVCIIMVWLGTKWAWKSTLIWERPHHRRRSTRLSGGTSGLSPFRPYCWAFRRWPIFWFVSTIWSLKIRKVDMEMNLTPLLMFFFLFSLLALGIPIAFSLSIISLSFAYFLWGEGGMYTLIQATWGTMNNFVLVAIPLFIFMAMVLEKSALVEDLYTAFYKWSGPLRGVLAVATILVGAVIGAVSGVVAAGIIGLGLIALPQMEAYGYDRRITIGSILSGGTLGRTYSPQPRNGHLRRGDGCVSGQSLRCRRQCRLVIDGPFYDLHSCSLIVSEKSLSGSPQGVKGQLG